MFGEISAELLQMFLPFLPCLRECAQGRVERDSKTQLRCQLNEKLHMEMLRSVRLVQKADSLLDSVEHRFVGHRVPQDVEEYLA